MATLRELKGRIGSVKSSEKITGAMKMISSAKMRKAEGALRRLVPYRNQVQTIIGHLLSSDAQCVSPLAEKREVSNVALLVFGSDDGLCGAYNAQIFKTLLSTLNGLRAQYGEGVHYTVFPIGKKAHLVTSKLASDTISVVHDCPLNTRSSLSDIKQFTEFVKAEFTGCKFDRVLSVYTHFKSMSRQEPTVEELLPLEPQKLLPEGQAEANKPYLFEPDAASIFNTVLPLYVLSVMQQYFAENSASEQAARVIAMQSANDNAKKLLEELQLEYNKLRQQSITTELLDILGGQKRD